MQFTITLSDAEYKALAAVAVSVDNWIQNVVHERCRVAIEDIVTAEIQRKLNAGEPITGTKEQIVLDAVIESAADAFARHTAEMAARIAAAEAAQAQGE